jgi:cellulose synthase/poly-beta-1,6-N-acetylglucosamine synthase-like glycosyltransferase
MKRSHGVVFYPEITVKTFCPRTLKSYFEQRRRWERGTTKVLWRERCFYAGLFMRPKFLAIGLLIHLSVYAGIFSVVLAAVSAADHFAIAAKWFWVTFLAWFAINLLKGLWNKRMREEGHWGRFVLHSAINGILWFVVTVWARLAGFMDGISYLSNMWRKSFRKAPKRGLQGTRDQPASL